MKNNKNTTAVRLTKLLNEVSYLLEAEQQKLKGQDWFVLKDWAVNMHNYAVHRMEALLPKNNVTPIKPAPTNGGT